MQGKDSIINQTALRLNLPSLPTAAFLHSLLNLGCNLIYYCYTVVIIIVNIIHDIKIIIIIIMNVIVIVIKCFFLNETLYMRPGMLLCVCAFLIGKRLGFEPVTF